MWIFGLPEAAGHGLVTRSSQPRITCFFRVQSGSRRMRSAPQEVEVMTTKKRAPLVKAALTRKGAKKVVPAPAKKAAPAPAKKVVPAKKAAPAPAKKAAPAKKVVPAKKVAPAKTAAAATKVGP